MANKNALTSIKAVIAIAIESTAGTRPTSGKPYYKIPQVTALPDLDFEPDTIETTSYENEEFKSYLPGLKDTGGLLTLEANFTDYGVEMWDDITGDLAVDLTGKIAWLLITFEGTEKTWFVPIKPVKTGMPDAPVNDKLSINYNFTVVKDIVKDTITKTTLASDYIATSDYVAS